MRLADVTNGVYLVPFDIVERTRSGRPVRGSSLPAGKYRGDVHWNRVTVAGSNREHQFARLHLVPFVNEDGSRAAPDGAYAITLQAGYSEFTFEHIELLNADPPAP